MVLLRTYDERSVVYHSQGRIGTYAIYWGHEAIQAGAVHALEDEDWIFPSYRESAIGLLRGMPPATILSWWRGHPPAGGTRPTTTSPRSASRSRPRCRTRPGSRGASGCAARRPRADLLRRRRHLGGRVPRGRELRGGDAGAARPPLQQQPVGDLDAPLGTDARRGARRQGRRRRDPGSPRRRRRRARRLRGGTRRGRARPRGRGADVHRSRDLSRRAARDGRRPQGVHRSRAGRGGARERVRRPLRGLPPPAGDSPRRARRADQGRGGRRDAGRDRRRRGRAARRHRPRVRARACRPARLVRARSRRAPEDPR